MAQAGHLVAGQDAVDGQPDLVGHGPGDEVTVAGDHPQVDLQVTQVGQGRRDVGLGWIAEQDQALERQLGLGASVELPGQAGPPRSDGDRPVARLCAGGDQVQDPVVVGRHQGPAQRRSGHARRVAEDLLRCPLADQQLAAVRLAQEHAQAASLEVERQLRQLGVAAEVGRRPAGGQDRGVEGIAEARLELAVEPGQVQDAGRVRAVGPGRPLEGQPALGQRPGLVGAQDGHAPEVLDRRQALDQDAGRGQRSGAPAEVDRDDRGQQLGRQADGQGQGEQERFEEGPMERDVGREHSHDEEQDHPGDQQAEAANAALEVVARRTLHQPAGDLAVGRPGPGRGDDRPALAADDARAEEDPLLGRQVAGGRRSRRADLRGRRRLAAHRRLVDVQVIGADQATVGRHDVACRQGDEVAHDQAADRHVLGHAVADRARLEGQPVAERLDGRLRARLLDEAQAGRQDDDDQDDPGVDAVADDDADRAGDQQQEDQRARELAHEDRRSRPLAVLLDRIRPVDSQALGGRGGGQAGVAGQSGLASHRPTSKPTG